MADNLPPRDTWPTHGWRESAPDDQGLDAARLAQALDHLAAHMPHLDGAVIVRHGYLVAERYRGEAGPETLHNVKSVTKSVLSALIGIALQTGDLAGLDDTLGDVWPAYFTSASDSRKRAIRVRDLLTMRSGLQWAEYGPTTVQMTASKDWVRFVLDQPVAHEPGQVFNYSTGDTQLLSGILHTITGMTALEYADLYLFGPLGITRRTWPADPQGITIGGAELALSARDMAKFGYLVLNGGRWNGDAILPEAWVQESTTPHVQVDPPRPDGCPSLAYGYLWWLRPQAGHRSALAVGFGGQYIYVVPDLDLVIALTGDIPAAPDTFRDHRMLCRFNWVEEFIVPAVVK
ncbi:MAG: serine hydrolase [Anaerolineae bacterium]|nr:serine hydrolase [Anaerolineae bacterium]